MTTLKELFIKYEYPTDIKFTSNEKFLVPLEHLEITSWGPMGDGVRPKHDCENSDMIYGYKWLKFKKINKFADDEYTYPDILNLQVDVDSFYVDASRKLSEKEIADMFYHRIIEANKINELEILSKVFGEFLPWDIDNVDEIAVKLFLEEQGFITKFYDTANNYFMEEKEHYNEVLQIFKKIKKDIGEILYKYLRPHGYRSVTTDELQIILDNCRFTFTDFEDGILIKTIDEKYYTHVGSKFKFLLYLFEEGTYVNVQEKEESLLIKIYFSLSPNITSSAETYELQATPYDQLEEGSVTDEDGIEDI